jgi:hypothetical protein
MAPVTRHENGEGETMGCSHFQRGRWGGGEAAPLCGRRMTHRRARVAAGEVEGGDWRLEVKDDQRKLGR